MFFSLETKQLSAYLYPSGAVPFFQMTHNSYNFRTILEHFLYNLYVTPLRLEADPAQAFFTTAVISIHSMGQNGFLSGTAHLKVPELSLSSGFFVLLKSVLNLLYFSSSLFSARLNLTSTDHTSSVTSNTRIPIASSPSKTF